MSNFNNKTITSKGLELLTSALAGGALHFTRIVLGSGEYNGDIGMIEGLVDQKQSLDIISMSRNGSQVVLTATLTQDKITEGFYWKEIGVYAKGADNTEVLYIYGSAKAGEYSYISKDMLNEKMINVGVLVSSAQNITAEISSSLLYLSVQDLINHNNDETSHSKLRTWVQGLFDSLKLTWENITGKPTAFPPEEHMHDDRYYTEQEVDDKIPTIPTSLPANGGNADTVDGLHGWLLGTIDGEGQYNEINNPLYCKHNIFEDDRFTLHIDNYEVRTDYATNAGKFNGKGAIGYVQRFPSGEITIAELNDPTYPYAYETDFVDVDNIFKLGTAWHHVIYVPHSWNSGGHRMQIVTIFGDNKIFVRTSSGTTWTEFYDYKGEIENLKSTVVDGKTSVANAINGHLATQLSNQTAYSDLAYYITNQLMKKLEYKDFIQTFNNTTAITFEYYNVSAVSIMVGPGITFSVMSSKAGKLFFMNVNGIASGGPLSYKDVAPNTWVGWDGSPSGSGTAYVYLFVSTEPCNVSIYRASGTSGGGLSTAPIL